MEIYLSTKINEPTVYCTTFSYRKAYVVGGGGGTVGSNIYILRFGNIDLQGTVDVNDATLLQRYLAGDAEFDKLQMFYSDINRDGKTNVKDVTDLQQAITK